MIRILLATTFACFFVVSAASATPSSADLPRDTGAQGVLNAGALSSAEASSSVAPTVSPAISPANASAPAQPAVPRRVVSLDNGLRGVFVPYETVSAPTTIRAVVRTGRSDAAPTESGLALLAAHWLHHLYRDDLARTSDTHGVSVGPDETVFTIETAPERVPDAVRAVGRLLVRSTSDAPVSEAAFDSLRTAVAGNVEQEAAHPEARARMHLETVLYDPSTYGHPSISADQVSSYSLADVQRYLADRFGARRTSVYVVGSYDDVDVENALRSSLSDWSAGRSDLYESLDVSPKHRVRVFDHPAAPRTGIAVGAPVPGPGSDEYAALKVASRLIRQRLSQEGPGAYATAPHVMIDARRHASHWVATRQTSHDRAPEALHRLLDRLDTLRTTPPSPAALQQAQSALINRFMMQSSTPDGVAVQMAFLDRHGLSLDYFASYAETIQSVSATDVQRAVQTYLSRERLAVVVSGPAAQLRPHLKDAAAW